MQPIYLTMKKRNLILFLLTSISLFNLSGQPSSKAKWKPYKHKYSLNIGLGLDLRLSQPANSITGTLLGNRDKNGITFPQLQIAYFPTKHWGGYASVALSLYGVRRYHDMMTQNDALLGMAYLTPFPLITAIKEGIKNNSLFHGEVTIGGIYRYELPRWKFYTRVGLGKTNYLNNLKQTTSNSNYQSVTLESRSASLIYLEGGIQVYYMCTPNIGFFIDAGYREPLNKMYLDLKAVPMEGEPIHIHYHQRTNLRSMPLRTGVSFSF